MKSKTSEKSYTKAELRDQAAKAVLDWLDECYAKDHNDCSCDEENSALANAYAFGYNDCRAEAMKAVQNALLSTDYDEEDEEDDL